MSRALLLSANISFEEFKTNITRDHVCFVLSIRNSSGNDAWLFSLLSKIYVEPSNVLCLSLWTFKHQYSLQRYLSSRSKHHTRMQKSVLLCRLWNQRSYRIIGVLSTLKMTKRYAMFALFSATGIKYWLCLYITFISVINHKSIGRARGCLLCSALRTLRQHKMTAISSFKMIIYHCMFRRLSPWPTNDRISLFL